MKSEVHEKVAQLTVQSSPHLRSNISNQRLMLEVLIALLPTIVVSIIFFQLWSVILLGVCGMTAVLTEWIFNRIRKKKSSVGDLSGFLTGILIALTLPIATAQAEFIYVPIVGTVFAIAVVKMFFGGLGSNIFNPALAGRAFLMACFPVVMTTWIVPPGIAETTEVITSATPLSVAKKVLITEGANISNIADKLGISFPNLDRLLMGNVNGSLGETSALALLLGGIYLLIRKIICYRTVIAVFLGAIITSGIFYLIDPSVYVSPLYHILSGGFMLGAFFMATDLVTSPITKSGRWIFGIGVGILIIIIRLFSGLPEGVMYAILFMNSLVPLINSFTIPKPLGYYKSKPASSN